MSQALSALPCSRRSRVKATIPSKDARLAAVVICEWLTGAGVQKN